MENNLLVLVPEAKELYPDLVWGAVLVEQVKIEGRTGKSDQRYQELLKQVKNNLADRQKDFEFSDVYKRMGLDVTERRPRPLALLNRLAKGKEIYPENNAVDLVNMLMLAQGTSIHLWDRDQVHLPLYVRLARRGEAFYGLGQSQATMLDDGELIYVDKFGQIIGRDLNYQESQISQVTFNTGNLLLVFEKHRDQEVELAGIMDTVVAQLTEAIGGKAGLREIIKA